MFAIFASTMDAKQLVSLPQLSRHLRTPARWLRDEADAGRIPHIRAGRQRLFDLPTVERVLAERAAKAEFTEVARER
ncbi:MAG: hypothetical protein IT459_17080 [Planctomycetes bacterium]|nr:hypothetical protein [Planctomycetota bacterium]